MVKVGVREGKRKEKRRREAEGRVRVKKRPLLTVVF
jgi:hypothetical protein